MSNYNQSLNDRLSLAAEAKKNMLEKFKKSLILDDPAKIEARRQREAIVAARAEREAQREAAGSATRCQASSDRGGSGGGGQARNGRTGCARGGRSGRTQGRSLG
jgi:hypothetical protein